MPSKQKFYTLGAWSLRLALAIYILTFCLYHYLCPAGGFSNVFQTEAVKPFVTLLFGIWGVCFHLARVMCFLIGKIFYGRNNKE